MCSMSVKCGGKAFLDSTHCSLCPSVFRVSCGVCRTQVSSLFVKRQVALVCVCEFVNEITRIVIEERYVFHCVEDWRKLE